MWLKLAHLLGAAPARLPRQVGAGVDLARSTGPPYMWQRWREKRARVGRGAVASVYREIWRRAAEAVGATLEDAGAGYFELQRGRARTRVWLNWIDLEDIVTHRLSLDKPRVHDLLVAAGVPVPEYAEFDFRDLAGAEAFLRRSDAPCVVKPASGTSGGDGVTRGIGTGEELIRARLRASRADTRLLIEREAPGNSYRLLILDGELLDAVRRRPPAVRGDGRSSVRELIATENRHRLEAGGWRGFRQLTVDLEAVLTLGSEGMTLRSVPPAGAWVRIKRVESQNAAHENETLSDGISPELLAEVVAAVRAVGLRLAGVDLVAPDLSRPLRESGGAIVEVNGTPGFQYHYLVAEPDRATPVAVPILRTLLGEKKKR
jgi:D-alanine-D-alanine ligase-like ATP-grasp enzyme